MTNSTINVSDQIRASREEMYGAFELFHTHVKYTISLMLSFLTALIAIAVIAERFAGLDDPLEVMVFEILGAVIFLMIVPIGRHSKQIFQRYFRVYIAAMQFADMLHKQHGMNFHPWLVTEGESEYLLSKDQIKLNLDNKSESKELSCALYLGIIDWIMVFAIIISSALVFALVFPLLSNALSRLI